MPTPDHRPERPLTGPSKAIYRSVFFGVLLLLPVMKAHAVPSFARQTGLPCNSCHTTFPDLTTFGRSFKLRGYTLTKSTKKKSADSQVAPFPPLSAMLLTSYTSIKKAVPDTQNNDVLFPDQLSLFYAGRIAKRLGGFIQLTYDGADDHFSLDNTDIRFADEATKGGKSLVYGATLNNNPTVQDLWNSTPAWSFPFASSPIAPMPAATTQVDGTLAQQVAGAGGYALWNDRFYGELTLYRNSQIGANSPPDSSSENVVDGTAPYWRFAFQHQQGTNYVSVGTYGLTDDVFPNGVSGPTDKYTDVAFDLQYQHSRPRGILTAHATYIHEKQNLDGSVAMGTAGNSSDTLNTLKLDAGYVFDRYHLNGTLAYFSTTGSQDSLLYAPNPVDGSATGKPDSNGWIAELDYSPWLNTKFALQYTVYNTFNGASSNYDGFGRNASDNNTLYGYIWVAF